MSNTFNELYSHLTSAYGYPVLPSASPKPHNASISHAIAELSIHPTLEAILHILNADLASAHFLCRHMQNAPAWEGMYIHGLLHRVEGDIENAKSWYRDVAESDCFKNVWPAGIDAAVTFLEDLKAERLNGSRTVRNAHLLQQSQTEIEALKDWCQNAFGLGVVEDATTVWVEPSEKHRQLAAKMVVGGEGWRQF
jgi:hypothetical protein